MQHTKNEHFIQQPTTDTHAFRSDRPAGNGGSFGKVGRTDGPDLSSRLLGKRHIERYMTWMAWKGENTQLNGIRIRSWKNVARSFSVMFRRRERRDYRNLLFTTLVPILPIKAWLKELRCIMNGVSVDEGKDAAKHIYVPGYWWDSEVTEQNGIMTIRFIGRKG